MAVNGRSEIKPGNVYDDMMCGVMQCTLSERPCFLYANAAACSILGYADAGELMLGIGGRAPEETGCEGMRAMCDNINMLMSHRKRVTYENKIAYNGGGYRWIRGAMYIKTDSYGNEVAQIEFIDSSDSHQDDTHNIIGDVIGEQCTMLSRWMYNMPCGIVRYTYSDSECHVQYINRYLSGGIKLNENREYAQKFWNNVMSIIPDSDEKKLRAAMQEAIRTRLVQHVAHGYIKSNGETGTVNDVMAYVDDENGMPVLQSVITIIEVGNADAARYMNAICSAYTCVYLLDFEAQRGMAIYDAERGGHAGIMFENMSAAIDAWLKKIDSGENGDMLRELFKQQSLTGVCSDKGRATYEYSLGEAEREKWYRTTFIRLDDAHYICCSTDISGQRREAERKINEDVARKCGDVRSTYRRIMEHAGSTLLEWDYANGSFYSSESYARYNMSNSSLNDPARCFTDPANVYGEDVNVMHSFFQRMMDKHHSEVNVRLRMRDGSVRWTYCFADIFTDAEGTPERMVCVLTDTRSDNGVQRELADTRSRMEHIIANIPSGIVMVDISGEPKLDYASEKALAMLGRRFDDIGNKLEGGAVARCFAANGVDYDNVIRRLRRNENVEAEIKLGGEKPYWLRLTFVPTRMGERTICYCTLTDISEKMLTLQRERRRAERYRLLSDATDAVIFGYDSHTDTLTYTVNMGSGIREERRIANVTESTHNLIIVHMEERGEFVDVLRRTALQSLNETHEFRMNFNGEGYVWYRCRIVGLQDADTYHAGAIGRCDNVEHAKERENTLMAAVERESTYRRALTANAFIALEYDIATGRRISSDADRITEPVFDRLTLSEAFEMLRDKAVHPDSRDGLIEKYIELRKYVRDNVQTSDMVMFDCRMQSIGGIFEGYRWFSIGYAYARDASTGDMHVLVFANDVNERRIAESRFKVMEHHDTITGLLNRSALEREYERISGEWAQSDSVSAFALIDVNGIIPVNQKYGRLFGDETMKNIADTLKAIVSQSEIAGRIGGQEFAIYMRYFKNTDMLRERVRVLCASLQRRIDADISLTVNIGVVVSQGRQEPFEDIFQKANAAMNYARRDGKNNFAFYTDEMQKDPRSQSAPEEQTEPRRVFIRTFGYFDVFLDGRAVLFNMPKTKELLALLVDRRGGYIEAPAAIACLWEDEPADKTTMARYRKTAMRLKETLDKYGIGDIVETVNGRRRIDSDKVECDLFQYLSGDEEYANLYSGIYMQNYSWGEDTLARLESLKTSGRQD